ncbi:hypothetical protein BPAE_0242g00020 [Botrytis paeoniae]|uniref:MalT-like TPR region domain-containing protein n=1 Tax=Botrytis paeoniae TaxID=278948 RepID=A0A4Z1F9N8_9HELO|nr:hypothetical protein BPAE_0242g00020 [Botrytis paeoniae]
MYVFGYGGDEDKTMKMREAGHWNNQANELEARGDFVGVESLFLRSLARKIELTGEDSLQTAFSRNALGELYLKMNGRIEDAQKMLEDADRVRSGVFLSFVIDEFDAACACDNLGQLWEIKGDVVKAREVRGRNPKSMICSNFNLSVFTLSTENQNQVNRL